MSKEVPQSCERTEDVREYAFDELPATGRRAVEQHLSTCAACAGELSRLRMATAALRVLPDVEIPQRIAFVSDKVFQPSAVSRWFGSFWTSAARLGFASACVLGAALVVSAYHRPATEVRTIVQTASAPADISKQVNEAVAKAVARVHQEDARTTQAALQAVELKYERKQRDLMVSVQENFEVLQKRLGSYTTLASADTARQGIGQ